MALIVVRSSAAASSGSAPVPPDAPKEGEPGKADHAMGVPRGEDACMEVEENEEMEDEDWEYGEEDDEEEPCEEDDEEEDPGDGPGDDDAGQFLNPTFLQICKFVNLYILNPWGDPILLTSFC